MTFTSASWWDCSEAEYYESPLPGSTALNKALTGNEGPTKKTGDLGNAIHLAVLRPDELVGRIAVKPGDVKMPGGEDDSRPRHLLRAALQNTRMVVKPKFSGLGSRADSKRW